MKNCVRFGDVFRPCLAESNPQPLDAFSRQKEHKDGYCGVCKLCRNNDKRIARKKSVDERRAKREAKYHSKVKFCSKYKHGKCASPINPQPLEQFRPQEGRRLGRSMCLSCEKKYHSDHRDEAVKRSREHYQKNKVAHRGYQLKKEFGITLEQHSEMHENQNGCCAICGKHETALRRTLHVDHCHDTGKVRGLLCAKCNHGIGNFNDDISLLERAIIYLKAY